MALSISRRSATWPRGRASCSAAIVITGDVDMAMRPATRRRRGGAPSSTSAQPTAAAAAAASSTHAGRQPRVVDAASAAACACRVRTPARPSPDRSAASTDRGRCAPAREQGGLASAPTSIWPQQARQPQARGAARSASTTRPTPSAARGPSTGSAPRSPSSGPQRSAGRTSRTMGHVAASGRAASGGRSVTTAGRAASTKMAMTRWSNFGGPLVSDARP